VIAGAVTLVAVAACIATVKTSVFAVRTIVVTGGTPRLQREVRGALEPELGRSLVRVGGDGLAGLTGAIPDLLSMRFDRDFPHTLRVSVRAERPVLLLRQGRDAWLVSARGRVLRKIAHPGRSSLPRVWVPGSASVLAGRVLPAEVGGAAAAAVSPIMRSRFPALVHAVRLGPSELTLVTLRGFQIRLGDLGDLQLKLAVARRLLQLVAASATPTGYIDVSVPQRPVYRP
jgi:cell division protein FtsQ